VNQGSAVRLALKTCESPSLGLLPNLAPAPLSVVQLHWAILEVDLDKLAGLINLTGEIMAIELYAHSMGAKTVKRELRQFLKQLVRDLRHTDGSSSDQVVHDTRTGMKRIRALLALLKSGLSRKAYREANRCCKVVATDLSGRRDRRVILDTLGVLVAEIPDVECRQRLLTPLRMQTLAGSASDMEQELLDARQQLQRLRQRSAGWSLKAGAATLRQGLQNDYREGQHYWQRLQNGAVDDELHAWRKPVKRFYYQLSALFPQDKRKTRRRLKALGEALGDLHDLHILRDYTERHALLFWHDDLLRLYRVLESREQALLEQIWQLAAEVYQRPADAYCHRLIDQWRDLDQPKS